MNDWTGLYGNPAKIALSFVTISFDVSCTAHSFLNAHFFSHVSFCSYSFLFNIIYSILREKSACHILHYHPLNQQILHDELWWGLSPPDTCFFIECAQRANISVGCHTLGQRDNKARNATYFSDVRPNSMHSKSKLIKLYQFQYHHAKQKRKCQAASPFHCLLRCIIWFRARWLWWWAPSHI